MKLRLENVRLSFPHLWKPQSREGGEAKYNASFLMTKGSEQAKAVWAACVSAAKETFGDKNGEAIVGSCFTNGKTCFRDGDTVLLDDGSIREGYEGCFYVSASSKVAPIVVDTDRAPLGEGAGRPYGGCFVNAMIDVYAMEKKGEVPRGIWAQLQGVQFLKDGDSFGAAPVSADDFDDVSSTTAPTGLGSVNNGVPGAGATPPASEAGPPLV